MIEGKTILAVITARGGSKGVPGKNIRVVAGKPLIVWTIEEAKKSKYIDRLILSSEDGGIIDVAKQHGCEAPFVRPEELAGDEVSGVAPLIHAIETLQERYDYTMLLQPTSPLRIAADIDGCVEYCMSRKAPSCVSVVESEKPPYWMYLLREDGTMKPFVDVKLKSVRRQDLPTVYVINGAVYLTQTETLVRERSFHPEGTVAYKMPAERSLDIDTKLDVILSECLLLRRSV
jgi:N-acylneuraminate cytidylyltransferase